MTSVLVYILAAAAALSFFSVCIIKQGSVGVVVLFGKYRRILRPGLNFKMPFMETVYKKISLQHRSVELEFQAITIDQANVNFKTLILYAVENEDEETIKKAAFKFIDDKSFMQALIRSIEGSIRALVSTKRQNEILSLRAEIVAEVNEHLEEELNDWGYHLINLQINDISFDEAIMRSMAQVVATNNMKLASENEAESQFISKTRKAEAEAHAIRIAALAERDADNLRGEGSALFKKQVAAGLADAGSIMGAKGGGDPTLMLYVLWLDSMKHIASHSRGNILSFDGSNEGFQKTMKQMTLLNSENGLPFMGQGAVQWKNHAPEDLSV